MTRKEAIQMLRLYELDEFGEGKLKTWYNGIDKDMQEAINMAIEALQDDWIPVSEKLPKYMHRVLISTKWGVTVACRDVISVGVTDDFWRLDDDSTIITRHVTAWKPIPAYMDEKEQENDD